MLTSRILDAKQEIICQARKGHIFGTNENNLFLSIGKKNTHQTVGHCKESRVTSSQGTEMKPKRGRL